MTELILGFVLGLVAAVGVAVWRRMKTGQTAGGALVGVLRGGGQGEE